MVKRQPEKTKKLEDHPVLGQTDLVKQRYIKLN